MKFRNMLMALVGVVVLGVPALTHAFSVVEEKVIALDATHVLYTVTYKLNFLNRDVRVPMQAEFGESDASSTSPAVTYTTIYNGVVAPQKESMAFVLSDAHIEDGVYFIPQGKSTSFTLVALIESPEADKHIPMKLQLTKIPFITLEDGEERKNAFNSTFLKARQ